MLKYKLSALYILLLIPLSLVLHKTAFVLLEKFSSAFVIEIINIQGATISKDPLFEQIINSSTNQIDTNLVSLDINKIKSQLEQLELIKEVTIQKDFPNTLTIYIIERLPIAQLKMKNIIYTIDKDGIILPIIPDLSYPTISVQFGVAINDKQIADSYLLEMISALTSTNASLIESMEINKNRETYFTLRDSTPKFYISTRILTDSLLEKAKRITLAIKKNNIQKIPKTIDIYSDKDTAIGFFK